VRILQKACRVTLGQTSVFASGWIFHARVSRCGSHKKYATTYHADFVILHPVQTAGQIVRSGAYGDETLTHYF
jgi:hypothetical protein